MNLHTFVVLVENKPGVLTRVSGLIRRRGFNIESLTVGHAETEGVSRMTIVVSTDDFGARRVESNLYKLIDVLRVDNVTGRPAVTRDLALVKVAATRDTRSSPPTATRSVSAISRTSTPSAAARSRSMFTSSSGLSTRSVV